MSLLTAKYPQCRLRRNRQDSWCRDLVAENQLSVNDLILPLFIRDKDSPRDITAMPGVYRHSLDELIPFCQRVKDSGLKAIALFPYTNPILKCEEGREALNPNNLVCQASRLIKEALPDLGLIVDVALDPYTSHGHDGVLRKDDVANDETVEILSEMALNQAKAGVDIIAPSDMMDGRIGAIRKVLDHNGYQHVRIMSYAAKYASTFYGPFRDALGSNTVLKGDKKTYQMDPANALEALREGAQDLLEGADMLMVKPGLPYLDIIYRLKEAFSLPIFAYQVSGEYSMLKAASERGWIDYDKIIFETLIAFKRAGASAIFTYAALDIAEKLQRQSL